jgi:SAM-dependent methyltransferase
MDTFSKFSSILSHPKLYLYYQTLVGGVRARKRLVEDYIRPRSGLVVLDVGCGPGYTISYFPEPRYYGFDVCPEYINYARKRFAPRGQFYCQYFDEHVLEWLPPVDVVMLMGLIHHLDDRSASDLFNLTKRAMKTTGCLFTLDGCYRDNQSPIAREFLRRDRGQFIRDEKGYLDLARWTFPEVTPHVREDMFLIPYTTLILECRSK